MARKGVSRRRPNPYPKTKFTPALFKRILKAILEKRFRVIHHPTDGSVACDHCGKLNAQWAVCLTRTQTEAEANFAEVGPVYLNGEVHMVGTICLTKIRKVWRKK